MNLNGRGMTDQINLRTYEKPHIVKEYVEATKLLGSERTLMNLLSDRAQKLDMLDIGVGGGRTTDHFAPLFQSYVGTDYAQSMVSACDAKYAGRWPFLCCDARDMGNFPDNSFDFLFFSFGGIDMLQHEDRIKVLKEIRRIGRLGAVFAFSAHNLDFAARHLGFVRSRRKLGFPRDVARFLAKQALNLGFVLRRPKDYAVINDGYHSFGLKTYYIAPKVQIKQLEELGFSNIKVIRQIDGVELLGPEYVCPQPLYVCNLNK
ncbi:MAG: hypothetical protein JWQ20_4596 [Conexibacter sp.]|nr:hypothetical protein [Conexibacter sp.]